MQYLRPVNRVTARRLLVSLTFGLAAVIAILCSGDQIATAATAISPYHRFETLSPSGPIHRGADRAGVVVVRQGSAPNSPTTASDPCNAAESGAEDATEAPADEAASDDACPVGAPPQSFSPTTRVELASGTFVPISTIKVGDKVLATDPTSGKTTAETVTATDIHDDTDLVDLVVHTAGGDRTIHTTDLHPVWDVTTVTTANGSSVIHTTDHHLIFDLRTHRWTEAKDLRRGDHVRTQDGSIATVTSTTTVAGSADMWDLTVDSVHDFYVVVTAGTGVLVHNVDGDCTPSTQDSWGNPSTLARHFVDHSADFGASTENEYALQASRFIQRSQAEGLPTKIADNGVIRAYDPSTNEFGSFNADGTTKTYFAPDPKSHGFPTNWDYWVSQPGDEPWTP